MSAKREVIYDITSIVSRIAVDEHIGKLFTSMGIKDIRYAFVKLFINDKRLPKNQHTSIATLELRWKAGVDFISYVGRHIRRHHYTAVKEATVMRLLSMYYQALENFFSKPNYNIGRNALDNADHSSPITFDIYQHDFRMIERKVMGRKRTLLIFEIEE